MSKYKTPDQQHTLFDGFWRAEELSKNPTALDKLNEKLEWELFRPILEEKLKYSDRASGGRRPFDPVLMLKILVLQKYHGLSDEQTEFQIKDRFSFQRFLGMGLSDDVPDEKTIWVFKERLGEDGVEALFAKFSEHLKDCGIMGNKGKIVDASFVDVPRQRNTREENQHIKEQGDAPEGWEDSLNKKRQKDIDARWTKKNDEKHFGYKNHVKVDNKSKLIESYAVTDASVHDSQALGNLLSADDETLYADSAYRSESIEEDLENLGIKSEIHEKGYRSRPLTEKQKNSNRRKSRIRARVEHVFGFQSNTMASDFIQTIGIRRAKLGIGLGNLIYNLCRFTYLSVRVA